MKSLTLISATSDGLSIWLAAAGCLAISLFLIYDGYRVYLGSSSLIATTLYVLFLVFVVPVIYVMFVITMYARTHQGKVIFGTLVFVVGIAWTASSFFLVRMAPFGLTLGSLTALDGLILLALGVFPTLNDRKVTVFFLVMAANFSSTIISGYLKARYFPNL